jgi:hypothetical protein
LVDENVMVFNGCINEKTILLNRLGYVPDSIEDLAGGNNLKKIGRFPQCDKLKQ